MLDWLRFRRHPVGEGELSAYLDGRLSPRRSRRLEEHLQSCAACQRKLDGLRTLVDALHGLPEVPAPRSFALSPEQAAPAPLPLRRLYPALRNAAAAAMVLLFVSIAADLFLQFHAEPGQPETAMLGAQRNGELLSPDIQGGAAAAEGEADGIEAFEDKEAVPLPAMPGEATPEAGVPPSAEEAAPSGTAELATPEAPQPAEAVEEEEEGDRIWLHALEGALGVIALGFVAAAFWARRRQRPA
jgi:hypothetical protein